MLTVSFHTVREGYSGQEVFAESCCGGNPDDSCEWPMLHHWVIRTTCMVGDVSHQGYFGRQFKDWTMSRTFGNPDNRCSR